MIDTAAMPIFRPIFYMLGIACFLISVAWVVQTTLFTGDDTRAASVTWIILSAAMAGVGAAFLIAGRYWMRPEL